MANNKVLSQLMLDAYKPNGQRHGFREEGFRPYGPGRDLHNGLRAQAYINEATKEVVVGIAGTNGLDDAAPDVAYVKGTYHDQFREAVKYSNELRNELGDVGNGEAVSEK